MFVAKVGIALACGWAAYVLLDHVPEFMPGGDNEVSVEEEILLTANASLWRIRRG